ncbi:glutathionylspermidine synthase family protein [Paenibacillus sp. JX-17]|uniref:Glutathionylspermidine synthase family protein n=1 Tax=Paenibacillus lacisoli TaxID=3064525 RepID=A0ABT9CBM4_9BACL|nr:glutathionylspermidine synthase family protein [Paenibacillus sp. JX-17]MDO7906664.1 glutathionylspermidine synthase family protein [Paenibacillus sp. JX-17]
MRTMLHLPYGHEEIFTGELERTIPYHRMYGKQYCLPALTLYEESEMEELRTAAEAVDRIYRKVMQFVQDYLPDSYLVEQLGIHPGLLAAIRRDDAPQGITRQDWILGADGLKCIENNADTPTGIPEAAYLERELLRLQNEATKVTYAGPSRGMDETLRRMFKTVMNHYERQGLGTEAVFTCYDWHLEDRHNTEYLMRMCREAGFTVCFAPLHELEIVPGEGLYHRDRQVHILYRLYPLEYLIHDEEEESGVAVGQALMDLAAARRLGLINPPRQMIAQSKGFTATLWSLYERNEQTPEYCGFRLFDDEELNWIERYLLPTYFEPAPFEQNGTPYVAKGYWGREGKGTALHEGTKADLQTAAAAMPPSLDGLGEADRPLTEEEQEAEQIAAYYENQPKIYQRLWPMQAAEVLTEEGRYAGYLLTGVFVIGGTFAGVLPRIGEKVTGDMAFYCAAAVREADAGIKQDN